MLMRRLCMRPAACIHSHWYYFGECWPREGRSELLIRPTGLISCSLYFFTYFLIFTLFSHFFSIFLVPLCFFASFFGLVHARQHSCMRDNTRACETTLVHARQHSCMRDNTRACETTLAHARQHSRMRDNTRACVHFFYSRTEWYLIFSLNVTNEFFYRKAYSDLAN